MKPVVCPNCRVPIVRNEQADSYDCGSCGSTIEKDYRQAVVAAAGGALAAWCLLLFGVYVGVGVLLVVVLAVLRFGLTGWKVRREK
jgi:uncharacterized paraquat-inducible protein A